jgi:hypothetical protein
LPEPLRLALQIFVERRLLLSDTGEAGQVWLTVAHEALLTAWRPLDTATADITAALRTARAVEQAAAEWTSADRPEHYLWDDKRLTATLTTLGMTTTGDPGVPIAELDDEAQAFLDATTRRVTAIKERERRRRTRTLTVLSTLLVLALIASIVAFQQRNTAQAERDTAIFNQTPPKLTDYAAPTSPSRRNSTSPPTACDQLRISTRTCSPHETPRYPPC